MCVCVCVDRDEVRWVWNKDVVHLYTFSRYGKNSRESPTPLYNALICCSGRFTLHNANLDRFPRPVRRQRDWPGTLPREGFRP